MPADGLVPHRPPLRGELPDTMSAPLRATGPDASPPSAVPGHEDVAGDLTMAELVQRAREHAEAEAAVGAVMRREDEKAAKRDALEHRKHHTPPLKAMLLLALVFFNLYVWLGNPSWLTYNQPSGLSIDYYQSSWELAVYLQRQRIEEYRQLKGHIPTTAQQAGPTVRGVQYTPIEQKAYQLTAGNGVKQFVYHSTDSLSVVMGRALFQMGLVAGGVR
jgi:hypothetical protein